MIAASDWMNGAWGSGTDALGLVNGVGGSENAWASACEDWVIAAAASSTSYAGFADEPGAAMGTSCMQGKKSWHYKQTTLPKQK